MFQSGGFPLDKTNNLPVCVDFFKLGNSTQLFFKDIFFYISAADGKGIIFAPL